MIPQFWWFQVLVHIWRICSPWHRNSYSDWCQWNPILSSVSLCHCWKIWVIYFLESPASPQGIYQIWLGPRTCILNVVRFILREWTCLLWVLVEWKHRCVICWRERYQFKVNDRALCVANLSSVELLMGSYESACMTMPILPPCSIWIFHS